ncbi:MAG TPA: hypothetical protein VMH86_10960, partial [Rhizomicrobium sp.]|nr:hypothetical protein [Rhizomicrobium sp.]
GRVACQMQYPTQGALRRVVSGNKQGVFKPLVCHAANHLAPGCLEPAWASRVKRGSNAEISFNNSRQYSSRKDQGNKNCHANGGRQTPFQQNQSQASEEIGGFDETI